MSGLFDASSELAAFSGRAPLFPLPDVVFFPHTLLPLHIFEPRYRLMTADALKGERLIAMAQLQPGWETATDDEPPAVERIVCLGHIATEERLADGRYHLLLRGLTRARVLGEVGTEQSYRTGDLELVADEPPSDAAREQRLRETLIESVRPFVAGTNFESLPNRGLDPDIPLSLVCDVIASAMPLHPRHGQRLLATFCVETRCQLLLEHLERRDWERESPPSARRFPPEFSEN